MNESLIKERKKKVVHSDEQGICFEFTNGLRTIPWIRSNNLGGVIRIKMFIKKG